MSTTSRLRANLPDSNRPEREEADCLARPTRHRPGKNSKNRHTTLIENGISGSCCGCANWMNVCERRAVVMVARRRHYVRQSLRDLVLSLRGNSLRQVLDTWIEEDEP